MWETYAVRSFFVAAGLSCLFEYLFFWKLRGKYPLRRLALCVVTANLASYLVLSGIVVWIFNVSLP